jgi:hypothetical protein
VLLQVLLGEVLQVTLGETDLSLNCHTLVITGDLNVISQVASAASDFNATAQELTEVSSVEDLILDGLGTVDGEGVGHLSLASLFLDGLDLGWDCEGGLCLFCGHWIIDYYIKNSIYEEQITSLWNNLTSSSENQGIALCSNYSSYI